MSIHTLYNKFTNTSILISSMQAQSFAYSSHHHMLMVSSGIYCILVVTQASTAENNQHRTCDSLRKPHTHTESLMTAVILCHKSALYTLKSYSTLLINKRVHYSAAYGVIITTCHKIIPTYSNVSHY